MKKFDLFYWKFPEGVHNVVGGCTIKEKDRLVIMIDSLQPEEVQKRTLKHEIAHIALNHLDKKIPEDGTDNEGRIISDSFEDEAEEYAEHMTDKELEYFMKWANCSKELDLVI